VPQVRHSPLPTRKRMLSQPPPAVQSSVILYKDGVAGNFRKFEKQLLRSCRIEVVNGFLLSKGSQSLKI
jgi:hypothetical protein